MADFLFMELKLHLSQVKQMYSHWVNELILSIQTARVNFQLIFNTVKQTKYTIHWWTIYESQYMEHDTEFTHLPAPIWASSNWS